MSLNMPTKFSSDISYSLAHTYTNTYTYYSSTLGKLVTPQPYRDARTYRYTRSNKCYFRTPMS